MEKKRKPLHSLVSFQVNDRLLVYILIGIMAVLSIVTMVGNRDAAEAARSAAKAATRAEEAAVKGDLIAECLTPGSRCSEFRAEQDRLEEQNVRAQNRCILEAILLIPPQPERASAKDAFLNGYDECVKRESRVAVPEAGTE